MHLPTRFIRAAITAAVLSVASDRCIANPILWSSTSSTAWLTAANWTGSVVPGSTDIAQFGVNSTMTATVGINLNGSTNNGTANQIVGAIQVTSVRTTVQTINNSSSTADGTLTVAGQTINGLANVVFENDGSSTLTLANGSSRSMNIALGQTTNVIYPNIGGIIISSAIGQVSGVSAGITKVGTAQLTLSGINTYSGGTTIAAGTIQLTGGTTNRLLSTGALTLGTGSAIGNTAANSSGVLALNGVNQTFGSLVAAGTGTGNAVIGTSTTASTLTINNSSADTFSGKLGGIGTNNNNLVLSKSGGGTLTLSGTNTYTGGTLITAGTLQANNATSSLGSGVTNLTSTGVLAGGSTTAAGATGGAVVIGSGGTSRSGTITAGSGATSSDTVGSLASGDQLWKKDGTFFFKFASSDGATATNSDTGSAGSNWDLLKMGTLSIDQGFAITLSKALAGSFSGGTAGEYLFATTTGVISKSTASTIPATANERLTSLFTFNDTLATLGIDPSHFQVDVGSDGKSLYLNYDGVSPVPEPTVVMMSGLGGAALFVRRSRRTGFSALRWLAALRAA